jgi:hypothetical protein
MANRDLLKEAIADAKAVKETAIANAKAALEEVFNPMVRERLAAKIAEMDEIEETSEEVTEMKKKEVEETYSMDEADYMKETEKVDEVDLDELLRELESMEEAETINLTDFPDEEGEHGNVAGKNINEAANFSVKLTVPEIYYDSETGELADSPYDWYTEDELEDANVSSFTDGAELADVVFDGDLSRAKTFEKQFPGLFKVMTSGGMEETKKMMKEASEEEEIDLENMSEDDLKSFIEDVIADMVSAGELEAGEGAEEKGEEKDEEAGVEVTATEKEEVAEAKKKTEEMKKKMATMKKELDEAYSALETIKSELNEVNLFNAKLLYTNKIFRTKNLTESQKVKVLASFDKATSVKEAKLVYETLSEGFNEKKAPVNESLLRGSASKPAGVVKERKPIMEVNDQFARWQKLAGIK